MTIGIEQSVLAAVPGGRVAQSSFGARPIHVVTNAGPQGQAKLRKLGFTVQLLNDCHPAESCTDVDVIALDSRLAASTVDVVARLQARGLSAPIVLINGLASSAPQMEVLSGDGSVMGALALAASFAEGGKAEGEVTCRGLSLQSGRAAWNGTDLNLTVGEYRIVDLLASRPGQYCTYRAIYDCLRYEGFIAGAGEEGHCQNVRTAIKRIRAKFLAIDPAFDGIENLVRFGYRWRLPE